MYMRSPCSTSPGWSGQTISSRGPAPQPLRKAWPSARKMGSKLSQTLQQHDDEEDHGPEPPEPEPAPGWSYHEVVAPQRLDIVQRSPRGLVVLLRWRLHVGLHARGRLHAHRRAAHRRGGVRLHQRRPCHVHRHYARAERKHRCGVAVWLSERGVQEYARITTICYNPRRPSALKV